ncbi:transposase, Mutator family protein [Candidatus Erwinia dacicola]|uniref:Transposase, Mutator family protein n=1 Tax=Candidatus Erwinia dacicola TaxID=252393 RepID=A0A328TSI3_9GAMM|nr:transposase, Mutator family protein [Candidatus Erwinia dacicola]
MGRGVNSVDVTLCINAEPHERCDERETYHNGYRDRQYNTRLGTLDLRIPKLREGSYFSSFLEVRSVRSPSNWKKAHRRSRI